MTEAFFKRCALEDMQKQIARVNVTMHNAMGGVINVGEEVILLDKNIQRQTVTVRSKESGVRIVGVSYKEVDVRVV